MPDIDVTKVLAGSLPPDTQVIIPAAKSAWFDRLPLYQQFMLRFVAPRNYQFHKKFFCLIDFAYDHWEPSEEYKGVKIAKNSDTFRKEITIMAGCYDVVASLGGEGVKKVAKSISWSKMTEDEFTVLYDAAKDVIWERIFQHIDTYTPQEYENVIKQMMGF